MHLVNNSRERDKKSTTCHLYATIPDRVLPKTIRKWYTYVLLLSPFKLRVRTNKDTIRWILWNERSRALGYYRTDSLYRKTFLFKNQFWQNMYKSMLLTCFVQQAFTHTHIISIVIRYNCILIQAINYWKPNLEQ